MKRASPTLHEIHTCGISKGLYVLRLKIDMFFRQKGLGVGTHNT